MAYLRRSCCLATSYVKCIVKNTKRQKSKHFFYRFPPRTMSISGEYYNVFFIFCVVLQMQAFILHTENLFGKLTFSTFHWQNFGEKYFWQFVSCKIVALLNLLQKIEARKSSKTLSYRKFHGRKLQWLGWGGVWGAVGLWGKFNALLIVTKFLWYLR